MRRVAGDHCSQLVEALGVLIDEIMINPVVTDQLLQQSVDQREVGPRLWRQVNLGCLGDFGQAWVDRDQVRRRGAGESIKNA